MTQTLEPQAALKKTPLHDNHAGRGAKIVDFGGWAMPLQYGKVKEEHNAVREHAGLFDVSHMGLVTVYGADQDSTGTALNKLVPQNLEKIEPGKAVYTQFLNESGGILDDLIIYKLPALPESHQAFQQWLVVCNAGNTPQDVDWMKQHLSNDDVTVDLLSSEFSLLALQGPAFTQVIAEAGGDVDALPKRFHVAVNRLFGFPVLLCRTGYTGEDGVEIVVRNENVVDLWDQLLGLNSTTGILPVGLAARDTLRLEAAYPLHGHDIDPATTPLEAGLGWSVKLKQESDFIGKSTLLQEKESGSKKTFICFEMQAKAIGRQHDKIMLDGSLIGEVTSGSISPTLNVPIGMGYIETEKGLSVGDIIQIEIRNKPVEAKIVERPFYKM